MARVKTFTNGGSLLPSDLNAIEDDYEFAFSTYKDIADRLGGLDRAAAGVYLWGKNGNPIGRSSPRPPTSAGVLLRPGVLPGEHAHDEAARPPRGDRQRRRARASPG
jgi:hypothetical protein